METGIKTRINPDENKIRVLFSPLLIIPINYLVATFSGKVIGKWAFIPIILVEWCLFIFFILKFGGPISIRNWLSKPSGKYGWSLLALATGLIPIPIFLKHHLLLSPWQIWLPWIVIAVINPWIEEFYWRGLLLDYTNQWRSYASVLFSSLLFAGNHAVFGINSELFRGPEVFISTLMMGIIWAIVFKKTNSLRWIIVAHFLADFFNLSTPSFLDLYKAGW
jgi:membrane protease YdiL (CAAX protease family)